MNIPIKYSDLINITNELINNCKKNNKKSSLQYRGGYYHALNDLKDKVRELNGILDNK